LKGRPLILRGFTGLALAASTLGAAAPASSANDEIPSLRELLRVWTRAAAAPHADPSPAQGSPSRSDALQELSGGRGLPARCATPLVLALYQYEPRLNRPARALLERATNPALEGLESVHVSADGEFRIHYSIDPGSADRVDPRDDDRDGVPDGVERLGAELTDLLADIVHVLNWAPAPPPEGAPRGRGPSGRAAREAVDVFLTNLASPPGDPGGFVTPIAPDMPLPNGAPHAAHEGGDAVIFLDSGLASTTALSRQVVAHMLAHVVQMRESVRESAWWDEASATWMESSLTGDAVRIARRFGSPGPARGLDDDLLGLTIEAFLWPHYLVRSTGSDASLIRKMWEEMAAVPGNNTFEAIDRVARRILGSSLQEEIRVFNVWNLFLGQADDGRHYAFGSLLPTPQGDAIFDNFPARGASLPGPLLPLGSALVRLLGDGSQGGLRIRFSGDEPGAWDLSALVYSAREPGQVRHVQIEMDPSGHGYIAIPWRSLAVIDLLIQNLSAPASSPADYAFTIEYDPAVPYDLLSFTADDSGRGAVLSWSTESEERMAGWNILRGTGPLGPFSRINQFLLPGAGRTDQSMSYVFVDSSVEPGRKYYYYLEGVTFEGFTESSHPAGVRLGRVPGRALTTR
jgi:hypothetical protein